MVLYAAGLRGDSGVLGMERAAGDLREREAVLVVAAEMLKESFGLAARAAENMMTDRTCFSGYCIFFFFLIKKWILICLVMKINQVKAIRDSNMAEK